MHDLRLRAYSRPRAKTLAIAVLLLVLVSLAGCRKNAPIAPTAGSHYHSVSTRAPGNRVDKARGRRNGRSEGWGTGEHPTRRSYRQYAARSSPCR